MKNYNLLVLAPIITIALFYLNLPVIPDSEIIVSDVYGSNYHDIGYKDGHHLWTGYIDQRYERDLETGEWKLHDYDYSIIPMILADTYGFTNAGYAGITQKNSNAAGANCDATGYGKGTTTVDIFIGTNAAGQICDFGYWEWDISSISVFSTITDADIQTDVTTASNPRNVDFVKMTYQPSLGTSGADTLADDVRGNISDVDYVNDSTCCNSVANDNLVDLGTTAESDIQDVVSGGIGWFAIGVKTDLITRGSVTHSQVFGASSPTTRTQLQITYTPGSPTSAPDQVTGLTVTTQSTSQLNLSWTAPDPGSSPITGYMIERETHSSGCSGGSFSTIVADTGTTSTTYSSTGLSTNFCYAYRVSAINDVGTGTASSAVDGTTLPAVPTQLNATSQSISQIYINWLAPTTGNATLTGYKIERQSHLSSCTGGSFVTIVANTGNTYLNYTNTGLADSKCFSYRVSARNAGGAGAPSNVATAATFAGGGSGGVCVPTDDNNFVMNFTEYRNVGCTNSTLIVDQCEVYTPPPDLSCLYQTKLQAIANLDEGVWQNQTNQTSYTFYQAVDPSTDYYITCYDGNETQQLFTISSYCVGSPNTLQAGISLFDNMGGLLGAPSIVLILIAIFSMATGKNSPQILIIGMVVAGTLGALGLLIYSEQYWGLILVAAAVAIFSIKRYYF